MNNITTKTTSDIHPTDFKFPLFCSSHFCFALEMLNWTQINNSHFFADFVQPAVQPCKTGAFIVQCSGHFSNLTLDYTTNRHRFQPTGYSLCQFHSACSFRFMMTAQLYILPSSLPIHYAVIIIFLPSRLA